MFLSEFYLGVSKNVKYMNRGVAVAHSVGGWAAQGYWFSPGCRQQLEVVLVAGEVPGNLQSTVEVPLSKVQTPKML